MIVYKSSGRPEWIYHNKSNDGHYYLSLIVLANKRDYYCFISYYVVSSVKLAWSTLIFDLCVCVRHCIIHYSDG